MYKAAQNSLELSALCSTGVGGPRDSPTAHAGIAGGLAHSAAHLAGIWVSASPRPSGPRGGRALQGVSLPGKWQGELWALQFEVSRGESCPRRSCYLSP